MGGRNTRLRPPPAQRLPVLLQSAQLRRPLDVAAVPLEDGAQPLQQNRAGGASHGDTERSPPPTMQENGSHHRESNCQTLCRADAPT